VVDTLHVWGFLAHHGEGRGSPEKEARRGVGSNVCGGEHGMPRGCEMTIEGDVWRCDGDATQAVKRSEQEWKRAGGCMLHKTKRRKIKAPGVGPGAPEMVEKVEVVVETVGVEGGLTDADMAAALAAKGGEVAGEIARSPPPSSLPPAPPPESKKRAAAAMSQPHAHPDAARASKRERKVPSLSATLALASPNPDAGARCVREGGTVSILLVQHGTSEAPRRKLSWGGRAFRSTAVHIPSSLERMLTSVPARRDSSVSTGGRRSPELLMVSKRLRRKPAGELVDGSG
jgi:hypothetical protein